MRTRQRIRAIRRWCDGALDAFSGPCRVSVSMHRPIGANMCTPDIGGDCQIVIAIYKQWPMPPREKVVTGARQRVSLAPSTALNDHVQTALSPLRVLLSSGIPAYIFRSISICNDIRLSQTTTTHTDRNR